MDEELTSHVKKCLVFAVYYRFSVIYMSILPYKVHKVGGNGLHTDTPLYPSKSAF